LPDPLSSRLRIDRLSPVKRRQPCANLLIESGKSRAAGLVVFFEKPQGRG
jgi:hypothetical protein